MDFIGADYGVIGEGEIPAVALMAYLEGKTQDPAKVPGLFYRKDGRWTHAEEQYGFIKDANTIPFPDWELLQPEKYFEFMEGATMPLRGKRPAPILTSRGCPYLCTFCSSGLTNKRIMRYRNPRNIVDEIKFLKEKYGVNEIFFSDDNLTMDIKRAEEIFDLLINEGVNVHWRAPNGIRLDRLTPALVEKMARSGGYYVGVGVETGNEEVMKQIKKRVDLNIVRSVINLLHKHKIMVSGFFMCGLRGETAAQVEDSVRFALSVPFDRIQVSNYIPYPGSEDFSVIFQEDKPEIYAQNVAKFQESEYVPHFQEMSLDEIVAIQKGFIRRFYLRPRVILGFFLNLKFSQIVAIWRHPFIQRWFSRKQKWF
jgi:magnesium-protoporphyrin IX monomethyl ester (oxidative) cyclase